MTPEQQYHFHRSLALAYYKEANGIMMRSTPETRVEAEANHYKLVELGNRELQKSDKYRSTIRFPATPILSTPATKGTQS
jgi:hypothetical protein